MGNERFLFYYHNYKSSFIAGTTSCFSFIGSYPTTFVHNYIFSLNGEEKDAHDISCDWKTIGEDIMSGEKRFTRDYLNDRKHQSSLLTT